MIDTMRHTNGVFGGIALALMLAAASVAGAEIEDTLDWSFDVAAGGELVIEADRGSIEINAAGQDKVEVKVTRKVSVWGRSRAEKILAGHKINAAKRDNRVVINSKFEHLPSLGWVFQRPSLQLHFNITVPEKFNLNLKTAGGSITVSDLAGKARVATSGGSLRLGNIQGPIIGTTSGGNIKLDGCTDAVDVRTAGGSIRIGEVKGPVTALTSGGSIYVEQATGKTIVKTSGGSIELGDISGEVDARTSGGSIRAAISNQPKGDCALRTSGGSITVRLAKDISIDLDARTSGGGVSSELSVAGEQTKNSLRGKINNGGPMLTLSTSGGNININKK